MAKIPFEIIQKCINKDDFDFPTLIYDGDLRSPKGQKIYEKALVEIKKRWFSVSDYILVKKFGFKTPEVNRSRRGFKKSVLNINEPNRPKFISEEPEFIYDLISIRFHYILWVNSKDPEVIKKAIEFEKAKFAGETYEFFQNELKNKSVPELTHFHFLIK